MQVGDGTDPRTITMNVNVRLFLARKEQKFWATKALKRRSVNIVSDL